MVAWNKCINFGTAGTNVVKFGSVGAMLLSFGDMLNLSKEENRF